MRRRAISQATGGAEPDELRDLVPSLYAAALEPERWKEVLRNMLSFVGASRGLIGFSAPQRPGLDASVMVDLDPGLYAVWQEEFRGFDPIDERMGPWPETGSVFRAWDVVPASDFRRSEVFRAVYARAGIDDQLITVLSNRDERFSYFSAYRSEREGPFSDADEARARALAPHLVMAAEVQQRLSAANRLREAGCAALDLVPLGLVTLDLAGRMIAANAEAERILATRDVLDVRAKRLGAINGESQHALELAIDSARGHGSRAGVGSAGLLRLANGEGDRFYQVLVTPVPHRVSDSLFGGDPSRPSVLVAIGAPDAGSHPLPDTLRTLFGLTPALARLAAALASGKSLTEYAGDAGVSPGTARQQVKELFSRTGTHRQAELVRLLVSGLARIRGPGQART